MILMPRLKPWRPRGAKPIAKLFQDEGISMSSELRKQRVGFHPCLGNHRGIALD
jgi:hypothetical protein